MRTDGGRSWQRYENNWAESSRLLRRGSHDARRSRFCRCNLNGQVERLETGMKDEISFSFVRNVLDDVGDDQAGELNLLGGALFGREVYANSHKLFTGASPSFTISC